MRRIGFRWLWWIVFPPYAVYQLLRSSLKWYLKVPIILFILLLSLLAWDMTKNPYRVEIEEARVKAQEYFEKELDENVEKVTRLGEGLVLTGKEKQTVLFYKVLTNQHMYHVGFISKDGKGLDIYRIEERSPEVRLIEGDEKSTNSIVSLFLQKNKSLGEIQGVLQTDALNHAEVQTSEGVYSFEVLNPYQLNYHKLTTDDEKPKPRRESMLVSEVDDFLKEREGKIGKIETIDAYTLSIGAESYYFTTNKGEYLLDIHKDGSIYLKEKRTGVMSE